MAQATNITNFQPWTKGEKFLFRVVFIFLLALIVPLDPAQYKNYFHPKSFFWFLSSLTGYRPNFVQLHSESARWGLAGYTSWAIALGAGLVGGTIWTLIVRKKDTPNYNKLYYWLRVIVRYRVALGIIAFGFLKFYPMQMPYPAISNLETYWGDYNTYKIYWQQVGVSIWYEVVLGIVEIIGGILLFFRSTTALGALINAGVLYNIAHANLAYDGAVHVYSSLFVLFSVFLLVPYVKNLYQLFVLKKDVTPQYYYPIWNTRRKKIWAYSIKYGVVLLFTIVYGILRYDVHYNLGYLKDPVTPGLPQAAGLYNVSTFRFNGKELPYNPYDSVRWQNVIFEKWSTLTYKVFKPFPISLANGTPNEKDVRRNYELAGIGGGRRFLYYKADTSKGLLYLEDKNARPAREDDSREKDTTAPAPKLVWHFERPAPGRVILYGQNERKDSIYAVLDKVNRDYPLAYHLK